MDMLMKTEGAATVMAVTGRLDAVTVPEFEKKVRGLIDGGVLRLVIDFENLEYISSAGLRGLLVTAKLLKSKDGRVGFAHVTGTVREVFDISGFCSLFSIDDSVEAAIAKLS
jgi:stage II sporulation protein AA (anti-sigma F factor antagonist)